jgi:hypothetical protein
MVSLSNHGRAKSRLRTFDYAQGWFDTLNMTRSPSGIVLAAESTQVIHRARDEHAA